MKTYVKVISSVILFILSVTDLAGIIFYGKAFRLAVEQIKGLTPLSEAGEYRFFDSLFGYPLGVFFLIIFVIGHSLNFALNLLGCYVHDLRLQCLEYFGKFYKDGGRACAPLAVNPKYYDTVEN